MVKKRKDVIYLNLLNSSNSVKRQTSIRRMKKEVKRLDTTPKKNKLKKVVKTKSVNKVFYEQKQKKIFYLKSVKKLANRISRIQSCYVGKYLTYKKLEQAIIVVRFIGDENPKKHIVVNRYLKILRFVGLKTSGVDLLDRVNDYFLKNDFKIQAPVVKEYYDDEWIKQFIVDQEARFKKKKSRKRGGKKKKPKIKSNWGSGRTFNNIVDSFGIDVKIKRVDIGKIINPLKTDNSLAKIEKEFRKLAKLPSNDDNVRRIVKSSGYVPFIQNNVSKYKNDTKSRLRITVASWKKTIIDDCFYKMTYYRQEEIEDLFIKPEYAYAEKQLRSLVALFDELLLLFSLSESFASKPFPVLETLRAIDAAEKPVLESII